MAQNTTRRSQSVVPFGVGAIVEFEKDALMVAGLDVWPDNAPEVADERLAARLGVRSLRTPPPKPDDNIPPEGTNHLPYVRFPRWHFCPRCRALKQANLYGSRRPRCSAEVVPHHMSGQPPCGRLHERRRRLMVPLRFVAVCQSGHVEDFPWAEWAHSRRGEDLVRGNACDAGTLFFRATNRGGLGGLVVSCSCGAYRNMLGATAQNGLRGLSCTGSRPWLGNDAAEVCNRSQDGLVALQRGASNLYFPSVRSSILIPPYSSKLLEILNKPKYRRTIESFKTDGKVDSSTFAFIAAAEGVSAEELEQAYTRRAQIEAGGGPTGDDETTYRRAEYEVLQEHRGELDDSLVTRPTSISDYTPLAQHCFEQVTLVERLAETRALTGFSRIRPDATAQASLSLRAVDWRPAFRVHGEGIFLKVRQSSLLRAVENHRERIGTLDRRALEAGRVEWHASPEFVLLHTLAHVLIKRMSFEAGYGASSIRERIYCDGENGADGPMNGILLYTAAGDADGTLGGLVSLGNAAALSRVLAGAVEDTRWCGADPICRESNGQGPDSLNLAACHACCLLPETSCEVQNRLLDRLILQDLFSGFDPELDAAR